MKKFLNIQGITNAIDKLVLLFICLTIFCLTFSKAAIVSFSWPAIIFWLIKKVLLKEYKLRSSALNKPLLVFLAVNIVSFSLSVDYALSFKGAFGKTLHHVFLAFVVFETINSRQRLKIAGAAFISSVLMTTLDGLVQFARGVDFLRGFTLDNGNRIRASFATRNDFGVWVSAAFFIIIGISLNFKPKNNFAKAFMYSLATLMLLSLFLTSSRGAWLGFASGLLVITFFLRGKWKTYIYLTGISVVLLALYLLNKDSVSSYQRVTLWKEAVMIIRDFPFLGSGPNTYTIVAPKYALTAETGIYAHNSYLQMAGEIGLIGLLSFFWILVSLFRGCYKYLRNNADWVFLGIISALASILVHSFFDVDLFALQLANLFWLTLGLANSLKIINGVANEEIS